jgi:hypothetical protein
MIFYSLNNITKFPQYKKIPEKIKKALQVIAAILPFRVNNDLTENLINWNSIPNGPIFKLTFFDDGMECSMFLRPINRPKEIQARRIFLK